MKFPSFFNLEKNNAIKVGRYICSLFTITYLLEVLFINSVPNESKLDFKLPNHDL